MISKIKYIEEEIDLFRKDIELLETLKNKAIFEEIATSSIRVGINEEELIKILKEKIGEIDRQYKKFYDKKVKKELDYWRERGMYELAFLYVLREEYKEAIALMREELERYYPLDEKPFSNIRLVGNFFRKSKGFLSDYEHSILWEQKRLARNMATSTRDKNIEWSLRAAFASWECLYNIWKDNWRIFRESGEMTGEDAKLLRELTKEIKNIEGKIV